MAGRGKYQCPMCGTRVTIKVFENAQYDEGDPGEEFECAGCNGRISRYNAKWNVNHSTKAVNEIDHPEEFDKLPGDQQEIVIKWIKENILPRKTINHIHTSYGLKHIFEADKIGFYMTNGMFKGAMIACGYNPVRRDDLNCNYRVSQKSLAFNYYKR